jgi:hypothetical protein
MSHTTIYFLTETKSYDEAESRVTQYLDNETFFDYFNTLDESSGSLAQRRGELMEYIKDWDWKKAADSYLEQAEQYKTEGRYGAYGYNLIKAGELYTQSLTVDTYAFNIDTGDYDIPEKDAGWWVIAIDFHY